MGTQLTVHTEIKINGVWHHHGTPWIPRDYRLYSKIAPVRSDSKIDDSPVLVSEQSALPLDATLITQIGFHDDHCIKCYVMGLEKIKEFVQWFEYEAEPFKSEPFGLEGRFDFVYHNGWAGLPKTIIPGHRISDARFIFWFD